MSTLENKIKVKSESVRDLYARKGNSNIKSYLIDFKLRELQKTKGISFRKYKKKYSIEEAEDILKVAKEVKEEGSVNVKIRYPDKFCSFKDEKGRTCCRKAIGKGTRCYKHGGVPDDENLITKEEIEQNKECFSLNRKYDPAFHPMEYLRLCKAGLVDVEIAAEMMISVRTLQGWMDTYAEFSMAYEIGQGIIEAWWLKTGKDAMERPRSFNTAMYKYLTGNKLGYAERSETKNTTQVNYGVLVVPGQKSIAEWEKDATHQLPAPKEVKELKELNPVIDI